MFCNQQRRFGLVDLLAQTTQYFISEKNILSEKNQASFGSYFGNKFFDKTIDNGNEDYVEQIPDLMRWNWC